MLKSILAVSEGGPDAAMSFRLAARVAAVFDASVDALHLPVGPAAGAIGGLAMSGEAMPLIMNLDDERLEERSKESERAYKEVLGANAGSTYTAAETATLDTLVAMGRCSDLLELGRPGSDPENVAPATVEAAIHECARAVMIAPPNAATGAFGFHRPHIKAVEVFHFALFAGPLAAAQAEVNPHLLTRLEAVDGIDAIAGQLEQHELRIL